MKKTLRIRPTGALSNRLRVLDSGMQVAHSESLRLIVEWERNSWINVALADLVHIPPGMEVEDSAWAPAGSTERAPIFQGLWLALSYQCRHLPRRWLYRDISTKQIISPERFKTLPGSHYFLMGCHRFFDQGRRYDWLQPQERILRRVDEVAATFGPRTVGLHIRRGDHAIAIQNSPTDAFVAVVENELRRRPETSFFLATDDASVEELFRKRWGERILLHVKTARDRLSLAGIDDAFVDLLCLSRTAALVGSFDSSFAETAADIGCVPHVVATRELQSKLTQGMQDDIFT